MTSMRVRLGLALAIVCLLVGGGVRPALAADDAAAAARDHYQKGTKFFDLARYDDAIREFEAAYQAKSDPALLYNLAQSHRLAGHPQEALQLYRNYVKRVPDSPYRSDIDKHIKTLEKTIAEKPAGSGNGGATGTTSPGPATATTDNASTGPTGSVTYGPQPQPYGQGTQANPPYGAVGPDGQPVQPPPGSPQDPNGGYPPGMQPPAGQGDVTAATQPVAPIQPVEPAPQSSRRKVGVVLTVIGGGLIVVGAVGGMITYFETKATEKAANNGDSFVPATEKTGRAAAVVQWIGYGVGAAAAATGLILIATAPKNQEAAPPRVAAAPILGPSMGGALVRVTF